MARVKSRIFHERNPSKFRDLMREAELYASDIGRFRHGYS